MEWTTRRNINVSTGFYIIAQYGHSYDAIAQSVFNWKVYGAMHDIMSINLFRFLIDSNWIRLPLTKCQITSKRNWGKHSVHKKNIAIWFMMKERIA